jgi:hypothetical protein
LKKKETKKKYLEWNENAHKKNEITPKTQEITHKVPNEGFFGVWKSEIGDLGYL